MKTSTFVSALIGVTGILYAGGCAAVERPVTTNGQQPRSVFRTLDGKIQTQLERKVDQMDIETRRTLTSDDVIRQRAFIEAFTPFESRSDVPSNTILDTMNRRLHEASASPVTRPEQL
jgi:hypothetical protein